MLSSMTGYGKSSVACESLSVSVEIKTVNHRYCDVGIKCPRLLLSREAEIRKKLTQSLRRGKVDAFISVDFQEGTGAVPTLNHFLVEHYLQLFKTVAARGGLSPEIPLSLLMSQKDVLSVSEQSIDEAALGACLEQALGEAIAAVDEMRRREGAATREDIEARLSSVDGLMDRVRERSPQVPLEWQARLRERLVRYGEEIEIDPQRLAQEIALFADRCDISEELSRFTSHMGQFRALYESPEPVGRQMDFLLQEFNREVNTMGSKANDAELSRLVVALKAELEKIREQVQNLE